MSGSIHVGLAALGAASLALQPRLAAVLDVAGEKIAAHEAVLGVGGRDRRDRFGAFASLVIVMVCLADDAGTSAEKPTALLTRSRVASVAGWWISTPTVNARSARSSRNAIAS